MADNKMKILHLISGGDTGGAKTHILSLFKGLQKYVDLKIICFIENSFYSDLKKEDINIEVFNQKTRFDMSVVKKIVREINEGGYDIVHCHGARANFIGCFIKKKTKLPFITTIHSDYKLDFKDNVYKQVVFTSLNSWALKKFDYYLAVSDAFKDMLVDRGFNPNDLFVCYNGLDISKSRKILSKKEYFKSRNIEYSNEIVVGIAARLDAVKDYDTFIDAAIKALKKDKNLIFLIAGDGAERERIEAKIASAKLSNRIILLGFEADIYSFFNAIDINVLCSKSESFPYSILEGGSMGKVAITTAVGGLPKLIKDGKTGFLIEVGDSDRLSQSITKLAEDSSLRESLGANLRDYIEENFSSDAMGKRHFDVYSKIIKGRHANINLLGYYGFDNSGDDAILQAVVSDIRELDDAMNLIAFSKKPNKTKKTYDIDAVDRFNLFKVMKSMKKTDLFIFGGGTLLQNVTSTRSIIYYIFMIKLAKRYKKKIMVYANGIGPIKGKFSRYLSKKALDQVDLITLRDEDSLKYVNELGVSNENILLTIDPVFSFSDKKTELYKEVFGKEEIYPDRKLIGISLRDWKHVENFETTVARAIEFLIEEYNYQIILIPLHYPADCAINKRVKDSVKSEDLFCITEDCTIEQLLSIIGSCEIFIGMRLHSLIYAAIENVPMLGISYDPKVDGLFKMLDSDCFLKVESLKQEDLKEKLRYLIKNREDIQNKLAKQMDENRKIAKSNAEMALKLLEKR